MSYPKEIKLNSKIYTHTGNGMYEHDCEENSHIVTYDLLLDRGGVVVSDEWPQVGDEVITNSGRKAIVLGIHKGNLWIVYSESEIQNTICETDIRKPKSPEEELIESLDECIHDFQCQFAERGDIDYDNLAKHILSRFKIESCN